MQNYPPLFHKQSYQDLSTQATSPNLDYRLSILCAPLLRLTVIVLWLSLEGTYATLYEPCVSLQLGCGTTNKQKLILFERGPRSHPHKFVEGVRHAT
jgi:hypothetical protein